MSITYEKLSSVEIDFEEEDTLENFATTVPTRNDQPHPITRIPSNNRDYFYALSFIVQTIVFILLPFLSNSYFSHAVVRYNQAGSWASILMIVTLLGTFSGGCITIFLLDNSFRLMFLSFGSAFSIIMKICVGNILLLKRSYFSLLGLLIIVSAALDTRFYKSAKDVAPFSSLLIQIVGNYLGRYGISIIIFAMILSAIHCCVLLWWGAIFVEILSHSEEIIMYFWLLFLVFSLYWTTEVFYSMISFVFGGAILWTSIENSNVSADIHEQLLLYIKCALTTSFGSICKISLFSRCARSLEALLDLVKICIHSLVFLRTDFCSTDFCGCIFSPDERMALVHNQLTLCLLALHGRTFAMTAHDQTSRYSLATEIASKDYTRYFTSSIVSIMTLLFTVIFALLVAEKGNTKASTMYFCVCMILTSTSAGLFLDIYSSGVHALIMAYMMNPEQFSAENQIAFLRFLRSTERL